jgi:FkbM family methyltransferase
LHKAPGLPEIASLRADVAARRRFAAEHLFSDSETVPVTIDALVAEHGTPDFCKIDVEGFELAVLAGLTRPSLA